MKLRTFLCAPIFILSCTASVNAEEASSHADKPNIIYILADDTGIGDIGAYNANSKIPTPNLDLMAEQGMKFTDAHSPSSVCTPTRYSVLTGRYSWRSRLKKGVLWGYDPALIEEGRETVASLLKSQGYNTAGIGKWHLGLGDTKPTDYSKPLSPGPIDNGFDYYYGIPASLDMAPYVYFENDQVIEPATAYTEKHGKPRGVGGGEEYWRAGKMAKNFKHIDVLPNIITRAEEYIRTQKDADKPFFLYLPLPAPHQPWLPTEEFVGKSKAGFYGDFMHQVDSTVGQIVDAVAESGMSENTLIIFTSDNGSHWYDADTEKYDHSSNMHWRGRKGGIYEGGHRVPFIVKWPAKIGKNKTSDELVSLNDFMATAAAITGTKLPDDAAEDSVNLLPVLLDEKRNGPIRETAIMHSVNGTFAIRKGHWKLINAHNSGGFGPHNQVENPPPVQLFNLSTDPTESNNLYKQHPEKVKE
ncbi:sulfatase family protein, partial [Aliiglaciecola lipolytica]|uniref:sulfatase family protein n=1 Tax=Aliiglaciecola lipolytica TaxID=477689 RepID=UPI000690CCDB